MIEKIGMWVLEFLLIFAGGIVLFVLLWPGQAVTRINYTLSLLDANGQPCTDREITFYHDAQVNGHNGHLYYGGSTTKTTDRAGRVELHTSVLSGSTFLFAMLKIGLIARPPYTLAISLPDYADSGFVHYLPVKKGKVPAELFSHLEWGNLVQAGGEPAYIASAQITRKELGKEHSEVDIELVLRLK